MPESNLRPVRATPRQSHHTRTLAPETRQNRQADSKPKISARKLVCKRPGRSPALRITTGSAQQKHQNCPQLQQAAVPKHARPDMVAGSQVQGTWAAQVAGEPPAAWDTPKPDVQRNQPDHRSDTGGRPPSSNLQSLSEVKKAQPKETRNKAWSLTGRARTSCIVSAKSMCRRPASSRRELTHPKASRNPAPQTTHARCRLHQARHGRPGGHSPKSKTPVPSAPIALPPTQAPPTHSSADPKLKHSGTDSEEARAAKRKGQQRQMNQ